VRSELPKVAHDGHRRDRRVRDVILALDSAIIHLIRIAQQNVQILVGDPQQRQVEILGQQARDLVAQHGLVPLAQFSQLVVCDPVSPALRLVEMAEADHRYVLQP
jgi:hypothetical protein